MSNFEQPNIAIDVVPVVFNDTTREIEVVLPKRIYDPFIGEFALPGVLLLNNESVDEAVQRALEVKAGYIGEVYSETLGVYDDPKRDPRSTTISISKIAILPRGTGITPEHSSERISEKLDLPFDHERIISDAPQLIELKLGVQKDFTEALLGERFSTNDMKDALTSAGAGFVASNLARQLNSRDWLVKDGSIPQPGAGRPGAAWKVV